MDLHEDYISTYNAADDEVEIGNIEHEQIQAASTTAVVRPDASTSEMQIEHHLESLPALMTESGSGSVSGSNSDAQSTLDYANEHVSDYDGDEDESDGNASGSFYDRRKDIFVLSIAGKPIYWMHQDDEVEVARNSAILQALISFVQPADLKYFQTEKARFVVMKRDPLVLLAVDKNGQSEQQLTSQLEVVYAQILSTLTKAQISRVFKDRPNFDLRQLLGGTEVFLDALTQSIVNGSPSLLLSSLECLRLRKTVREKINNVLLEAKSPSLLYGLIVADNKLVSVIRPRRHSLHPPDLHLVFSMLFETSSFRDGEHWAPICLPKFNSSGFLYAYINFFAEKTALVLISPDKASFFEMQSARLKIVETLTSKRLVEPIVKAVNQGRVRPVDIPAPLIRHFLYKSKQNVQFVMPSYEPLYPSARDQRRLMMMYHKIHAQIHGIKYQRLKVIYSVGKSHATLAWITPLFEFYCVTGIASKEAIVQSIRAVITWIKKQEERLFIVGGVTF